MARAKKVVDEKSDDDKTLMELKIIIQKKLNPKKLKNLL
jgi:hypothetical protein